MKKILAICGSTRKNSTNHRFIKCIANLSKNVFEIQLSASISLLPHFNPDDDNDADTSIREFRNAIRQADGVIICTPEYAHGVPGSLKNAIDWTVGTADFSGKPTALITASTDGKYGHQSLLETLRVIEAKDVTSSQLLISFASTKINTDAIITDTTTLKDVEKLIENFRKLIDSSVQNNE